MVFLTGAKIAAVSKVINLVVDQIFYLHWKYYNLYLSNKCRRNRTRFSSSFCFCFDFIAQFKTDIVASATSSKGIFGDFKEQMREEGDREKGDGLVTKDKI